SGGGDLSAAEKAEKDDSASIPGTFYTSQGRAPLPGGLEGHLMTPFCPGVVASDLAAQRDGTPFGGGTPAATTTTGATLTPTSTPTSTPTATPTRTVEGTPPTENPN